MDIYMAFDVSHIPLVTLFMSFFIYPLTSQFHDEDNSEWTRDNRVTNGKQYKDTIIATCVKCHVIKGMLCMRNGWWKVLRSEMSELVFFSWAKSLFGYASMIFYLFSYMSNLCYFRVFEWQKPLLTSCILLLCTWSLCTQWLKTLEFALVFSLYPGPFLTQVTHNNNICFIIQCCLISNFDIFISISE